jgi:hypothetical protein
MPKKYVDEVAMGHAVGKIKELLEDKVNIEEGKGLSSNDYTTAEKEKLAGLENYILPTASTEVAGGVKVGAGLEINENGVLSATGGGTADAVEWANVQSKPADLAGFGLDDDVDDAISAAIKDLASKDDIANMAKKSDIANMATKDDIEAIEGRLTGVYHFKGNVADLEALEAIENPEEGDVYNIGSTGINAGWVVDENHENGGYWDQFGMTVDFDNIQTMTTEEIDALFA